MTVKKTVSMGKKEELNLLKRYKIDPFNQKSLFPSNETGVHGALHPLASSPLVFHKRVCVAREPSVAA